MENEEKKIKIIWTGTYHIEVPIDDPRPADINFKPDNKLVIISSNNRRIIEAE